MAGDGKNAEQRLATSISRSTRLTVVFYIILCLEAGFFLTVLPWWNLFGLADWGNNYFLLYAAQKTGLRGLQHAVSSGWVRGFVTGLGLLNLAMAFWEITHFRQTVRTLAASHGASASVNATRSAQAGKLPDHERRDNA